MKIIGLNQDIIWENREENFLLIEDKLKNISADLFVLPEMFSTGFSMNPSKIADRHTESLNWMKEFSSLKNTPICGSASILENDKFFNRMYFVTPDCSYIHYDKRHLFSFSGEDRAYTPGKKRVITEYNGLRILLQICYDLRFPVFSRNQDDYDIILYVANWPKKRVGAWKHLLKARAIENQCYVFGLNRIGIDGNNLEYEESSFCFFADGTEVSTKDNELISAIIDLEKLNEFREHYQFLHDRDSFSIEY